MLTNYAWYSFTPPQWPTLSPPLTEGLLNYVGHNLLKLFRFEAGMSGKVRGEGGTGNDRSALRKNCCCRVIPADRHSQLVDLQTG